LPLVIASTNQGKLREFGDLFARTFDLKKPRLLPVSDFASAFTVDETGATFAENARIKAIAALTLSGHPSMGDDSGLCVNALNGEPGVRSARWMGEGATDQDRNVGLLDRMQNVPIELRTARFECALCIAFPDGSFVESCGVCPGLISLQESGSDGFGYDPVFVVDSLGVSMAQLTMLQKNEVSHRTHAVRQLREKLLYGWLNALL
jgi:XTP/dITP diphosphohydrolase